MDEVSEKELFETVPAHKAVVALAIPSIISQVVSIIYNLADTFFIGQFGNPYMVAGVTLVSPWFNLLTALGNLFGIGGSSLISRQLGSGQHREVKQVAAFSLYGGMGMTFLFSMLTLCFRAPLLRFLGASDENFAYAQTYLLWVVVIGGIPTMLSMTLAHLLRSEGHAKHASAGMMFGGILNLILDPLLMFVAGMGFVGSAIATACSNLASVLFFLVIFYRLQGKTMLSLSIHNVSIKFARPIFSVGIASAMMTVLANASNMVIVKLASGYGDIPVAAYGIVKRIDLFPLGICMGLCQGFMPLVGYNYAAKNYKRMRQISVFSWKTAMAIAACFVVCFFSFAPWIMQAFIQEAQTSVLGASFLRIACLAVPLTAVNALIIYTMQAMGKGSQATFMTVCRQGLLNIPCLLLMNWSVGLYGMIWTQLIIETLMLPVTIGMYAVTWRRLTNRELSKGGKTV